eukprot:scaffold85740_cov66-Phaeocystis_antarctica.AAC.9
MMSGAPASRSLPGCSAHQSAPSLGGQSMAVRHGGHRGCTQTEAPRGLLAARRPHAERGSPHKDAGGSAGPLVPPRPATDRLSHIDLLLLPEDLRVEMSLQALVGEDANESASLGPREQALVDAQHEPSEELGVDGLAQRVAGVARLLRLQGNLVQTAGERLHGPTDQCLLEGRERHVQKVAHGLQRLRVADFAGVLFRWAKRHVAQVQEGRQKPVHACLLFALDTDGPHRQSDLRVALGVVDGLDPDEALAQIGEVLGPAELERLPLRGAVAREQLVEAVVVALLGGLLHGARFLEQVADQVGADEPIALVEMDPCELSEAARVVVHDRLRVTKRFQQRVAVENLFCEAAQLRRGTALLAASGLLRRLATHGKLGGGVSGQGQHSGGAVRAAGPGACVRVNEVLRVSKADVVEQGWLVQMHQLRVVADSVEVCRVDWLRHRVVEVCVLRTRTQTGPGATTHRSCASPSGSVAVSAPLARPPA